MAMQCAVLSAVQEANPRIIMSGYPQDRLSALAEGDSFTNQILMAAWDQALRAEQPSSPRSKALLGGSHSDVQQRRDRDASSGPGLTPTQAALQQLQLQFGGGSEPGSETGGSAHQHSCQDEVQKPVKRGRGRQRKATGVETAQQRAHRRFYERKKQRMAALEQEARDKEEEYQQLLAINIELRRKHEALERAVAGRDEHLVLIQALGSLSLDARARHQQLHQHLPPLHEQPRQLPGHMQVQQQEQRQNQASMQQPQPVHHLHSQTCARQSTNVQGSSWADLHDQPRSRPASAAASVGAGWQQEQLQQPSVDVMPVVEEAGPFGLVQLPQFGSADDDVLPLAPPDAATARGQQAPGFAASAAANMPVPQQQQPGLQQLQQQPHQGQQEMSWTALELPQRQQQQQPWPAGGFVDLLEGPGMSLTRSLSMPARTGGFDTDLASTGLHAEGFGALQGGLGAPQVSRSFSSTPTAWMSRVGHLRATAATAEAPAASDWELGGVFAAAAAAAGDEGGFLALRQPGQHQLLPPGGSRHHSWSGAGGNTTLVPGGLVPKASLSFDLGIGAAGQQQQAAGGEGGITRQGDQLPAMAQLPGGLDFAAAVGAAAAAGPSGSTGAAGQQGQQPAAWLQQLQHQQKQHEQQQQAGPGDASRHRPSWGATITTAGPLVAPAPCQQQLQQPGLTGLCQPEQAPVFAGFDRQQLQPWPAQQQQGAHPFAMQPSPPVVGMLPGQQQQGGAAAGQHPFLLPLQPRRSALEQPEPQQVVQQLQQMGDIAFGTDLAQQQLATADMPDDILLFDADMMDMLERLSQQQSVEMLSPLPSIPSALLTGDSLRQALADPAMAAALAAGSPPGAHNTAAAGPAAQQQQQQAHQQPGGVHGGEGGPLAGTAAAAGSPPGSPLTLLEASRQLQARHMAAGFFPSRSANEMFYVHEIVDWYKEKLQQLQQLLPYVDRPCPDVSCGVSLVQTMEDVIDGVRKFGARNRIGVWELKLINLETGEFQEAPPSHWAMVAEHVQVPPQMRESAVACYSLYLEYVEKVKADRLAILSDFQLLEDQLQAAAGGAMGSSSQQQGSAPPSLQFRVDGYEEYQVLIERLQLSLKREHMVSNMLSYSLSQIASHVQMAKGMLACWPYWPDGPSVLSFWLAEEQARGPHAVAGLPAHQAAPAGPSGL